MAIAWGYYSSVGVVAKEVAHDNYILVVLADSWNDTIDSVQYPQVFRIAPFVIRMCPRRDAISSPNAR